MRTSLPRMQYFEGITVVAHIHDFAIVLQVYTHYGYLSKHINRNPFITSNNHGLRDVWNRTMT
jgi:hypothetical protein